MSQLEPTTIDLEVTHPRTGRRVARTLLGLAAVAAVGVGVGACSNDDDGADVRASGPGAEGCASGSASASASGASASASGASASGCASGSASASASAPAAGSASGSGAAAECQAVDGTLGVADADTTVAATLDEFSIAVDPAEAAAGAVGFVTENAGEEPHELVIARGAPADITVVEGAPDESALDVIGEVESFPSGETCEGTFELTAGDYVLFCALVEEEEDGTVESHYEEGMVTTFTVS